MRLKKEWITKSAQSRLYGTEIPIIGLTGGIATGKSTVSKLLKDLPIIDADKNVKKVYSQEESIEFIHKHFPNALNGKEINFPKLRELVFNDERNRELIEKYIYSKLPGVFKEELEQLGDVNFVIYDVPLLFEKQLDTLVDVSVTVYAPKETQIERLLQRDGSSAELAAKILASQFDIEEKKKRSNFIINNNSSLEQLSSEVKNFKSIIFEN